MTEPGDTRVGVYIDFDNIVISRYDQVHGRGQFQRDRVRGFSKDGRLADPDTADKIRRATVDVGAVIDFASSFGTLVLTRAYADWSAPVNADYRGQLVSRAVDLVQLFPAAAYVQTGTIRLQKFSNLTNYFDHEKSIDSVPLHHLGLGCYRSGRGENHHHHDHDLR